MKCALCQRESDLATRHHLVPRSENGKHEPTVYLCSACHRQLHSLFSNSQLANEFNTLEKIRSHPEMQKFLLWIRRQDPNKRIRVKSRKR